MWFSSSRKRDAFEERGQQQEVWRLLRRLIDLQTPSMLAEATTERTWNRSNRCLPVAFVPVAGEEIDPQQVMYGPTKDLSDNGLSLILPEAVECTECVCGFWLDTPKLVSGVVRRVRPFGGNLFEVGIQLVELIESTEAFSLLDDQLNTLAPNEEDVNAAVE